MGHDIGLVLLDTHRPHAPGNLAGEGRVPVMKVGRWDNVEVHCHDVIQVVAEKRAPVLGWQPGPRRPVPPNGGAAHIDPELVELGLDARRAGDPAIGWWLSWLPIVYWLGLALPGAWSGGPATISRPITAARVAARIFRILMRCPRRAGGS